MEGRLLLGIGTGQKRNLLFCEVIMNIEEALKVLSSALQNDPYYARVFGVNTTRGPARAEIRNTCESLLPNSIDFEEYMDSFAIHVLAECVQNRLKQKRQEGQAGWYCDLGELSIKDRIRDKVSVQHMSTKDVVDVACYAAMLLAQKVINREG